MADPTPGSPQSSRSPFKSRSKKNQPKPYTLLVIAGDYEVNWEAVFVGAEVGGRPVRVVETRWEDMNLTSYSDSGAVVSVRPLPKDARETREEDRAPGVQVVTSRRSTVTPDFVLIRALPRGVPHSSDHRTKLFGLMYANVPAVNTLHSVYMFLERPLMYAELAKIQREVGAEAFPLIDQTYYATHKEMMITPTYPIVVKVGHAHAGYGKVRLLNHKDFEDFTSVVAMTHTYCTAERYYEGEYDLRIQKIGNTYRCYKRMSVSGNWKTNTGSSMMEEIEISDEHMAWADLAATTFGGLDILAVDAIHTVDGDEYILEVNDCSIGFGPDSAPDLEAVRLLVLDRMHDALVDDS